MKKILVSVFLILVSFSQTFSYENPTLEKQIDSVVTQIYNSDWGVDKLNQVVLRIELLKEKIESWEMRQLSTKNEFIVDTILKTILIKLWNNEINSDNQSLDLHYQYNWVSNEYKENENDQSMNTKKSSHINNGYYTSSHHTSYLYYCSNDSNWEGLSKKYLQYYSTERELLSVYPTKKLNKPCE